MPPGAWYEVWTTPTAEFLERGPGSALQDTVSKYGAESQEAAALKGFIDHADTYGAKVPTLPSAHLDELVRSSGMAPTIAGSTAADEEESGHRLGSPPTCCGNAARDRRRRGVAGRTSRHALLGTRRAMGLHRGKDSRSCSGGPTPSPSTGPGGRRS